MGVNIVSSNPDVFATNAPILTQSPPIRQMTREYVDRQIFTDRVRGLDDGTVRAQCDQILEQWKSDPQMATTCSIRSTVIQVFFQLLSGTTISKADADFVTRQYIRRFVEMSLFTGYLPWCGWAPEASPSDVYFVADLRN